MVVILQIVIHAQVVHRRRRRRRFLTLQQWITRGAPLAGTAAATAVVVVVMVVVEGPEATTCSTSGASVVRHRQAIQIRIGEFSCTDGRKKWGDQCRIIVVTDMDGVLAEK